MEAFKADTLAAYIKSLKYKEYSKNKIKYINIPAAFDIEVSSWDENGDKRASMYIWMMGISDYVFYGRTWNEWLNALQVIADSFNLGHDRHLICGVHNLAYEFQFIRKHLKWSKVFATDQRKPLECFSELGIVFRCTYMLSGESLDAVGKKIGVEKKSGQLDYNLIRHSQTPLTPAEMEYCEYDILVVLAYIQSQITLNGGKITKIPLTKTGYVRNYCRRECLPSKSGAWFRYRRIMQQLTLEADEYTLLHSAFQGGFTHANARKSHKVFENVASYDFTSSYPACMVLEQFPMSKGFRIDNITEAQFEYFIRYYCCLFRVTFYNIDEKITADHPISASRCRGLQGEITDNGRIAYAAQLTLTITDVDWFIIKDFYNWDHYVISDFYYYYRGYLPTSYVRSVLGLYKDKTELKGVKGREHDYVLSKELLNSSYGMMVTNIIRDEIIYDKDEWKSEPVSIADKLEIYNNSKKRFLSFPWGVWVTAYARKALFTGIKATADDYIYADTDSLKLTNNDKYKAYFEQYNNDILKKIEKAAEHHGLDPELFMPKSATGSVKVIGQWDYEGTYLRFKTLGAKRYMTEDDNGINITVSGLNKAECVPYLTWKYKNVFDAFNNELYIPPDYTGKNIHTYIDEPQSGTVTDYLDHTAHYEELSSIHLDSCDYHLSIAQTYINYLLGISEGDIL